MPLSSKKIQLNYRVSELCESFISQFKQLTKLFLALDTEFWFNLFVSKRNILLRKQDDQNNYVCISPDSACDVVHPTGRWVATSVEFTRKEAKDRFFDGNGQRGEVAARPRRIPRPMQETRR